MMDVVRWEEHGATQAASSRRLRDIDAPSPFIQIQFAFFVFVLILVSAVRIASLRCPYRKFKTSSSKKISRSFAFLCDSASEKASRFETATSTLVRVTGQPNSHRFRNSLGPTLIKLNLIILYTAGAAILG